MAADAPRELYDGPLEPGMVMVALGNDGEPFRRDLVLGLHPYRRRDGAEVVTE